MPGVDERLMVGRFSDGPVCGLGYRSDSTCGVTAEDGAFRYRAGERVEFSIGQLTLGVAIGASRVTPVDLAGPGRRSLSDSAVMNRARFLHSFADQPDLVEGVTITPFIRDAVGASGSDIDFDQNHAEFAADPSVTRLLGELGLRLKSAAEARNHLRRSMAGIKKLTDVRIPMRDGSHLLADVFLPIEVPRAPALLRMSVYGRAFGAGVVTSDSERLESEMREDAWFAGPREALPAGSRYSECQVSANTMDWVPRGYVCVRIDSRGVGLTPGPLHPFSQQEALDYYDAIEWAARQPWCDGNVGLYGASYAGTNQWRVAGLRPPGLRAMMPYAADGDPYRELAYPGGLLLEGYRQHWWSNIVIDRARPAGAAVDFMGELRRHPYDDPDAYGPDGKVAAGADYAAIRVPALVAVSQGLMVHARGGFEAFREIPGGRTELVVAPGDYFRSMYADCLEQQFAFFDRYLKGADCPLQPVRFAVRTGPDQHEWRYAETWPPPGTQYRTLYLDAAGGYLQEELPAAGAVARYSAEVDRDTFDVVSFVSEPFPVDTEIIGHPNASLYVSSTSHDMDVYVALRVVGADGEIISYAAADPQEPLTYGALRVSHRKLDQARSNSERPFHTHREADVQLLSGPEDIVRIDIEIYGLAVRIPAGSRLRLDVAPAEENGDPLNLGVPLRRAYDLGYHDGAHNRVHTGDCWPSQLRLPVHLSGE